MLHLPMSAQLAWLIRRSVPWNLNLNNNVAFELRFESIRGEREPPSEFGISIVKKPTIRYKEYIKVIMTTIKDLPV